jgi:DNA repair exonuclease SbcCD ATPase subunit
MPDPEETKKRLEQLKADQEKLKAELAELDTFMEKRVRQRTKIDELAARRPPPAPPSYPQPYAPPPQPYPPAPPRGYYPEYYPERRPGEDETTELLRMNIAESKKLMEKFDYLLDTLITSMEEVQTENVEGLVKHLAETQMHLIETVGGVRDAVDKTKAEAVTREEVQRIATEQATNYKQLNEKMNALMERVEHPPYIAELDAIRVAVSNLASEVKRVELAAGPGASEDFARLVDSLKDQTSSLDERMRSLYESLANIQQHVYAVESTTGTLADIRKEMDKTRELLSAKEDAVLAETDRRMTELESRVSELNAALQRIKGLEEKIKASPVGGMADVRKDLEEIKKAIPTASLRSLESRLDRLDEALAELLKKNREK